MQEETLAGRLDGDRHRLAIRVYFEDTDFSGIVYHGALIRFFERGRSDFLRLLGVHHSALADGTHGEPLFFAVRDLAVRFLKPARIDDILTVTTSASALGRARVVLAQRIDRGGSAIATATVEAVLLDREGRPRRMPAAVRAALEAPSAERD